MKDFFRLLKKLKLYRLQGLIISISFRENRLKLIRVYMKLDAGGGRVLSAREEIWKKQEMVQR